MRSPVSDMKMRIPRQISLIIVPLDMSSPSLQAMCVRNRMPLSSTW